MTDLSRILVVAPTERELTASAGWRTLCCGVGPVDAAATTAAALAVARPAAILHIGIAGTRRALPPATLVIGTESRYHDLSVPAHFAPGVFVTPPALVAAAARAFPGAPRLAIGTSGRIGGTTDTDIEAMEGYAVLRAAQMAGVPAIEVRVISNEIEQQDRTLWYFEAALTAVHAATPRLVEEVARCAS